MKYIMAVRKLAAFLCFRQDGNYMFDCLLNFSYCDAIIFFAGVLINCNFGRMEIKSFILLL